MISIQELLKRIVENKCLVLRCSPAARWVHDQKVKNDRFLRAMTQCMNTPQPDTRLSPTKVVYGRYVRNFIPVVVKYKPKQEWRTGHGWRSKPKN